MDKDRVSGIVEAALDRAETTWSKHGTRLQKAASLSERRTDAIVLPSSIPGHPSVDSEKPAVGSFIAWVMDLRQSTQHMTVRTSTAKVSELQRIYYETAALLPMTAAIVTDEGGSITEYLGDGLLGLFAGGKDGPANDEREASIRSASRAARQTIEMVEKVLNPRLHERYLLPPLAIGIGMALSPALVTIVGIEGAAQQAKAFGRCVWRASKLSKGHNEIRIDDCLYEAWPSSTGGKMTFAKRTGDTFGSYVVGSK